MTAKYPLVAYPGEPAQPIKAADTLLVRAPTSANASANLPHGTAPASPANGDVWTTTGGIFVRVNGLTVGPLGAGATPGGSSGQIQYNNAGALGGFTVSGDATINTGTGALTLAASGVTAASYTYASITVDAKGRITAASSGAAPPAAANPTATIGGAAVNGSAGTFMRSDAAPALANTAVAAGSYSAANITVDAQGRITAASSGTSTPSATGLYEAAGTGVPVVSSFAWVNQGTASAANGTGSMIITAPANASLNVRIFKMAAPGSTPWNIYARIDFQSTLASFPSIQLAARNSTSGKFITFGPGSNGARWNVSSQRWASATSFNAAIQDPIVGEGPGAVVPKWYRINNDGTTLTLYWSVNGWDWVAASTTEALATYVGSVDEIGIAIRVDNGSSVAFVSVFQTTAPS